MGGDEFVPKLVTSTKNKFCAKLQKDMNPGKQRVLAQKRLMASADLAIAKIDSANQHFINISLMRCYYFGNPKEDPNSTNQRSVSLKPPQLH